MKNLLMKSLFLMLAVNASCRIDASATPAKPEPTTTQEDAASSQHFIQETLELLEIVKETAIPGETARDAALRFLFAATFLKKDENGQWEPDLDVAHDFRNSLNFEGLA